jgi:hypothetical protein
MYFLSSLKYISHAINIFLQLQIFNSLWILVTIPTN